MTTKTGSPSDAAQGLQGIQFSDNLDGFQGTIATGIIASKVATKPMKLQGLLASAATAGTAGNTVLQVHVNGVSQGSVTLDSGLADPVASRSVPLDVDINVGDVISLVVSTAPTAGANLSASADLVQNKIGPAQA